MNLLLATAIILGACLVTCGCLYAFHRLGSKDALLRDTTRGAGVYAVVGTSFAVLLAFVVFIAFESYDKAKAGAESEADSVLELFRAAEYFPPAQKEEMQGEILCYARAVVSRDWPAMRDQSRNSVVDEWSFAMQHTYPTLQVSDPKEEAAFGNLLGLSEDRVDARRQRLTEATPIITSPVWFILGLGALLNVGFVLLFIDRRSESLTVQAMLMASVTTMVVAGLLLIWFLDHPYADSDGSIKPVEMERTIRVMGEEDPGSLATPPCTETGEPPS